MVAAMIAPLIVFEFSVRGIIGNYELPPWAALVCLGVLCLAVIVFAWPVAVLILGTGRRSWLRLAMWGAFYPAFVACVWTVTTLAVFALIGFALIAIASMTT